MTGRKLIGSGNLIPGIIIFVLTATLFSLTGSFSRIFPTRETDLRNKAVFGPLVKDFLFVQEMTMDKRYLSRIDIYLAKMISSGECENIFLLLDPDHNIIYTKRISSAELDGAQYYRIDFGKKFDIGKNRKIFACLYSVDGVPGNCLALARNPQKGEKGFYVTSMPDRDAVSALMKMQGLTVLEGMLGCKVYEADSLYFSAGNILSYLLALMLGLLVAFFTLIRKFITGHILIPEKIFAYLSLVFGTAMVFITPPFQVPDEPAHLCRAYQVSGMNFFKTPDSVPSSLWQISAIGERMKFKAHEKTGYPEIRELLSVKLNSKRKTSVGTPDYIIPYIPQATGMMAGRILGFSALGLLYAGRMANLLVSVLLIFFAIRITPVMKWIFFILGILPMALYQMSSLSYDAPTFSLAFLLTAFIFRLAFGKSDTITNKEIFLLLLLTFLLAASKPPYFILAFSFLAVPVARAGSGRKYMIILGALLASMAAGNLYWKPAAMLARNLNSFNQAMPHQHDLLVAETSLLPAPGNNEKPSAQPADTSGQRSAPNVPPEIPKPDMSQFRPGDQIKVILSDPAAYLEVLAGSLQKYAGLYLISFVGLFGWVDTPLPPGIIYSCWILLLLLALSLPVPDVRISIRNKILFLAIFILGFAGVETAMYLYCNPVGSGIISAVQGRYFLPLGPTLFIVLYNHSFTNRLRLMFMKKESKSLNDKRNRKRKPEAKTSAAPGLFEQSLPWITAGYGIFALMYSVYLILFRFYIITI